MATGCGGRCDVGPECCELTAVTDIVGTVGKITGESRGSAVGQEIDADASGGRSKCMPARQLARSGRGRRKRQFPVSDAASRKIHPRAERRRRSASEARFSPPVSSNTGWTTARVPRKRHAGCPYQQHAGAAGAVKRPVVPHAPSRAMRNRDDRLPQAGQTTGAMTCVCGWQTHVIVLFDN